MRSGRPFLKRFLALAFCFIGMANSGFTANIATVDATGRAALSGHSEQKARRFALEDALYLAALKNGVRISGTLVSHNGVLLRDIITQNSDAKLVDFKILKENKSSTHYQVSIRAFFAKSGAQTCANPRFGKPLCCVQAFPSAKKFMRIMRLWRPNLAKQSRIISRKTIRGP